MVEFIPGLGLVVVKGLEGKDIIGKEHLWADEGSEASRKPRRQGEFKDWDADGKKAEQADCCSCGQRRTLG